ncbi:MAG TPA: FAD-dependent monooxygenase [Bacteroidia bacterium]|nr:FAD-dependent monooxygenase [Bacteroidia bacterium]
MRNTKILVSGAGVGGLTVAYFLKQKGFTPVVIEKASSLRDGGYMIDFFSSGISVAEKMGIIEQLKEKDHRSNIIIQQNEKGEKQFILNMSGFRESVKGKLFNFLRTDLVDVLYKKVKEDVEIRFSTSIQSISQDSNNVTVTFENGKQETFDLLIGADGLRSNVRAKVYAPEKIEELFLGCYVCGLEHNVPVNVDNGEVISMLCPKRQIMTYTTGKGVSNSLFVFKSPKLKLLTTKEEIDVLNKEFAGFASPVPEIINEASKKDKLFFDQVTQIRIHDQWHKNRVVLIGDAAFCITLLSGQGSSMAMTAAYVLSEQLEKHRDDYETAFTEYEKSLRPMIEKMQKKAVGNSATFIPASKFSLWIRNLFAPLVFKKIFSSLLIKQLGANNYFEKE